MQRDRQFVVAPCCSHLTSCQPAIASHVGRQNGCKMSFHVLAGQRQDLPGSK
jgi:hypothetical protein